MRTHAAKRRAQAEQFDPGDDDPPGGASADGELARKPTLATTEGKPVDKAQRNFTDPESSIMKGADGFIQACNARLAVDEAHQVIVACGVTDQPADAANLEPMLERVNSIVEARCTVARLMRTFGLSQVDQTGDTIVTPKGFKRTWEVFEPFRKVLVVCKC